MEEKITKPTIETVLTRMNSMEERLVSQIGASEERLVSQIAASEVRTGARIDGLESRFNGFEEYVGSRLDRIESLAHASRAVGLELRADFRDLRVQLKEHFPIPG